MSTEAVELPPVFDGLTLEGSINVTQDTILNNVRYSIRQQHPQVWQTKINGQRVALVGGGPSLNDTVDELKQAVFEGAKLVTVNGSYDWCIARNLQPKGQIVLDARPSNARFVQQDIPECRYWICSQCDPAVWQTVAGRPWVGVWHDVPDDAVRDELNQYYLTHWISMPGGTTVGTRAIGLLRTIGYLRFDLFGFDSCFMGDDHHAYSQPENDRDRRYAMTIHPTHASHLARTFQVAGWHVRQLEDLVNMIRLNGDKFALNIHGDGLLAYALRASADVTWSIEGQQQDGANPVGGVE